ncbi:MAG: hypothetical protein C0504_18985 [Candidatus Solibacter sp.]|nr:hypothetical protein [Candidatus Solibacter sp.]
MEFFDANGLRQPIRANGIDRTTSSYDLNPKSTLDVVLDDLGSSTKIGFAKVAFLGSRELRITVFYADSGGVEGAVTSFSSAALETVPFDMTEGVSTSIAVVASQETGIPRIGLNCYDSAGKKLDSVGLTEVGQKYQAVDLMSKAPQLVGHKGFCSIVEQNGGSATWTAARHFVVSLRFKGRSFVPTTF